ncbi:hypothetical protein HanRHA438_Chr13g0592211 [Helianthus annuus]|uniref:Uncharacterized protein n=1 Tax=Helianthus annuus TaxID=4232 RepID=A0A251SQB8_HELAN|nr:hypothetical protein HanXRQr2_Chr13g0581441 [Helianthus annuus]KAJ0857619.1 hypothetical protein HanRHA438_Chr13g0592211 [Helianthus annuus]
MLWTLMRSINSNVYKMKIVINLIKICIIILVQNQMDSTTRLPIILAKGTGHFVTISNLDKFDECPNNDKLNIASSISDNLDDKNPCQYSGFKSKKASKKLLVPFKSSFKSVSIPNR